MSARRVRFWRGVLQGAVLLTAVALPVVSRAEPGPEAGALAVKARVDYFRSVSRKTIAVLALEFSKNDLKFVPQGGMWRAQVNLRGSVNDAEGKVVLKLSQEVEWRISRSGAEEPGPAVYERPMELGEGHYLLKLDVEEASTHGSAHVEQPLEVPDFSQDRLAPSSLVLLRRSPGAVFGRAVDAEGGRAGGMGGGRGGRGGGMGEAMGGGPNEGRPGGGMRGETKGEPSFDGQFARAERVGIFLQAYNFKPELESKKPKVAVEYVILRGEQVVFRQQETLGEVPEGKALTLTKSLALAGVQPGEYIFRVRITDEVRGQTVEPQAKFTVVP